MSVIKYMFCIHNECNKISDLVFTMSVIIKQYLFCIHNEYNKIYFMYSQ